MYRRLDSGEDAVLAFEVEGTIAHSAFEEVLGDVRRAIDRFGAVRLLLRVHGWPTTETPTLGERLRFAREHHADIERYAVVGDSRAIGYLTTLADAFVDMDLRFFEIENESAAWAWLRDEGTPQEASA
ncbi:STAS/SEC14 domain-containing protein [Nocardiopsis sp. MG754419]|uniref:STAS/SEC14 domain-containing protein n=1 Tax=Nocardiopsis sp. MG754419 TaxID=2259865 RepID=UPI001BA712A9|nr:STAS/SEC14 domain-containing protein [Nocardiopsis sp. MG754419]MBR8740944.1 STAS/SEC14 domain-containing protein [Nocardiopsis sp. MG754419]